MITPLGNRVYVKHVITGDITTSSGLILKKDKGHIHTAEVLAVGTGRVLDTGEILPINLQVGDRVVYTHGATELELDGEVNYIVDYSEILAVV